MITRRIWLSVVGMVLVAAAMLYNEGALSRSPWGADYFPNVTLTTQTGQRVRLYDDLLRGKSVAVNTFFAGCGDVCPLGTAKMLELKKLLGDRVGRDIFFYSFSIDPVHDTPEALKAYADRFDVGAGWLFLTGREEDIRLITRKLGLGVLQNSEPREGHSTTLMVGNEATGQWMKSSAIDNPRFVAASIRTFLGWEVPTTHLDYAKAEPLRMTNGQFLFQNGCSTCHTIGQGARIGPDLMDVTVRRDRQWLERFVLVPNEVLDEADPVAVALLKQHNGVRMPNLGLARDEVADILAHIDNRSRLLRDRSTAGSSAR